MDQSLCARWDVLAKHASEHDVLDGPACIWLPRLYLSNTQHVVELPRYIEHILGDAPYTNKPLQPPLSAYTLTLPKHASLDRTFHELLWSENKRGASVLRFPWHAEAVEAHRALVTLVVGLLRDMGRA